MPLNNIFRYQCEQCSAVEEYGPQTPPQTWISLFWGLEDRRVYCSIRCLLLWTVNAIDA